MNNVSMLSSREIHSSIERNELGIMDSCVGHDRSINLDCNLMDSQGRCVTGLSGDA